MTDDFKVHEAGGRIAQREGKGDKYRVRLMGWEPGESVTHGSSADYPVEMQKAHTPAAFPKGTRMKANHDGFCTEDGGDIRRVIARSITDPWAESDGMYTDIQVSEQWSTYFREFGDIIGLSISAGALLEDFNDPEHEDYDPDAPRTVKRFLTAKESPYNSIDFVEAPGADGRITMALESAKSVLEHMNIREAASFASGVTERKNVSEAVPPENNRKENSMDEKERQEFALAVAEATASALKPVLESSSTTDRTDAETPVRDVAEAIIAAGLPEEARAAVYEAHERGGDWKVSLEREAQREAKTQERIAEAVEKAGVAPGYTSGPSGRSAIDESFNAVENFNGELDSLLGVK